MTDRVGFWYTVSLAECAQIIMGQSPDSSSYNELGNGLAFFQGKAEFGLLNPRARKWCTSPTKIAESNDILLSVRAPVGPSNLATETCCIGRGLAAIRAYSPIDQKFLFYQIRAIEPWLSEQGTGTTFKAISGDFIRSLEVSIAPLNEQKRIADKLDQTLAIVERAKARLARVPEILKQFRQSILAAATNGRLTEDWRTLREVQSDSTNASLSVSKTPLKETLSQIKTGPFGSALHRSDYVLGGIPVINPMHINSGKITPSTDMCISAGKAVELSDFRLRENDVVIARRGVMGRCAVVSNRENGWLCGTGSMVLRADEKLLPDYLSIFLSAPETIAALEADSVGSTMVNLNQGILLGLEIWVPEIEEQTEIIRRVETLFALADRIEARYKAAADRVDKITQALLAKAFRGELVPQDPADEPAAVLLERIRAQREVSAQSKPPRGRKIGA